MMLGMRAKLGSVVGGAVLVLAACSSTSLSRAPVEDRNHSPAPAASPDARTQAVKQPPGFENAGKSGYYAVKPGDTLIRIGLESGQSPKDIARWNGLDNPNKIEVGQVLRVSPPSSVETASVKPVTSGNSTTTSLPPASAASAPAKANAASATASSNTTAATPAASGAIGDEAVAWMWPSNGPVLAGFDEAKNKGIDIGGNAGDAVLAAAEGKVVYAGSGLRAYGNLIILKHNNTYLTAYAHNQTLLVKEDQTVKKGQKIAEMGNSDADRVKLHFEVRKQGKPVDPTKYMPVR